MSNATAQVGSERPVVAGAVYAMTNDASENQVLVYRRNSKGLLTFHRPVLTHGRGSGGVLDPLDSQGSLALSEDNKFLFVANAGSGTISSFRVVPSGLVFVDQANSGGAQPLSIAIDGDLLYLLNNANITGFHILQNGSLSAIPASTRFLAAIAARDLGASDIVFSPNGSFLVLTERLANQIVVFPVEADGVTGTPVHNNSHGNTPFSCAFTPSGVLIVAEFAGGPDGGAASSYTIAMDGTLQLISGSVPTQGKAACWNVVTPDGKACVVTNSPSDTAALFSVSEAGELSFVNITSVGPNTFPIDTALTPDGLFLYTLNAKAGSISAYRLDESSRPGKRPRLTLTLLGSVSDGLTGSSGLNGLAAR